MSGIITKSVAITSAGQENQQLAKGVETTKQDSANTLTRSAATLINMRFFESKVLKTVLGDDYGPALVAFSEACKAARDISSGARKKHALEFLAFLLAAQVGNGSWILVPNTAININ
jgi:hypothetical protein